MLLKISQCIQKLTKNATGIICIYNGENVTLSETIPNRIREKEKTGDKTNVN